MQWLAALGGFASAGFGIVALIFVIRNKGLALDAKSADTLRRAAEETAKTVTADFNEYRDRAEAKEARLVAELEHYENHELDDIEAEPNRPRRIERRRNWVRAVLSKASNPAGDDGDRGVSEDAPTKP